MCEITELNDTTKITIYSKEVSQLIWLKLLENRGEHYLLYIGCRSPKNIEEMIIDSKEQFELIQKVGTVYDAYENDLSPQLATALIYPTVERLLDGQASLM